MTPLERILLEALEGIYPLAIKYRAQAGGHNEAIDAADNAISLAHRTADGHPAVRGTGGKG